MLKVFVKLVGTWDLIGLDILKRLLVQLQCEKDDNLQDMHQVLSFLGSDLLIRLASISFGQAARQKHDFFWEDKCECDSI